MSSVCISATVRSNRFTYFGRMAAVMPLTGSLRSYRLPLYAAVEWVCAIPAGSAGSSAIFFWKRASGLLSGPSWLKTQKKSTKLFFVLSVILQIQIQVAAALGGDPILLLELQDIIMRVIVIGSFCPQISQKLNSGQFV